MGVGKEGNLASWVVSDVFKWTSDIVQSIYMLNVSIRETKNYMHIIIFIISNLFLFYFKKCNNIIC